MVRETSAQAYRQIQENGLLPKSYREIYEILLEQESSGKTDVTRQELYEIMKKRYGVNDYVSHVSARLAEMRDNLEVIEEAGTRTCGVTGLNVIAWTISGKLPKKLSRAEKIQRQIAEFEQRIERLKTKLAKENP